MTSPAASERFKFRLPTYHRYADVNGIRIFYREAGPPGAPVLLLLHGFPTSSRMFRTLIPALSDRYRLIAPDYPGFGHSDAPDRSAFAYSFANIATLLLDFLRVLKVDRHALYIQDFGAPVGLRMALEDPARISALIIQNGNAYEAGLSPFFDPLKAFWADASPANRDRLRSVLTLDATRWQYVEGVEDAELIDPDTWLIDHALLQRPGIEAVMLDLFLDYRTNLSLFPRFQEYFRMFQPPTLIVWGENDVIFPAIGAQSYLQDLPGARIHMLNSGHFALEDHADIIADHIRGFLPEALA
jgi:pimeloyl-ACP methyl ester carboxylesterase